jgi:hypothetical protein
MNDKVTTYARPQRGAPAPRAIDAPRPWHVHDKSATLVGGVTVIEKNDQRTVLMTQAEAQFYVDQGIIGEEPAKRDEAKTAEADIPVAKAPARTAVK